MQIASHVHHEVLPNGLQLVVKENHTAPVAAVRIYVKTGSIYEQEYLGSGISHYFEHLISGGTTSNRGEKEISELLDFLGGRHNAYTTKGHTAYYITTAAGKVEQAVELMADWMKNSQFPENEFKREKNVVLQELYKGREEPARVFQKEFAEAVFKTHPARYPVIGYEEQVKAITRDDILTYYKRMYVPNNMVVVAVGDFDGPKVAASIKDHFKDFKRRALPAISLPEESRQLGRRVHIVDNDKMRGAQFRLGFRSVTIDDHDLYALDVLSYILSHGRSSRLVSEIVEKQQLAISIYSYSHTPEYDAGTFGIGGQAQADNVDEAVKAAIEQVKRIQNQLVSPAELEKAKRQKIADDVLYNQTAEDEASDLGINVLMTGNSQFGDLYLKNIAKVTADEVRKVARKYLTEENMTVVVMRPSAKKANATDSAETIEESPIRMATLPNGLRVLVKRNPNVPIVSMQAYFLGGVRLEPEDKAGVSRLTGELITRGTTTRSGDEIAEFFDALGGRISSSAGNNTLGVNCEVLKQDFDQALAVFADIIQNPVFPADEFEKLKQQNLVAIAKYDNDWQQQIYRIFRKEYFQDHPYSHIALGTTETVQSLKVEDLKSFYHAVSRPGNGVIAVFGDIEEDATITALTAAFGKMQNGEGEGLKQPKPYTPPQEARTVAKPVNRGISAIMVGYPGVRYTDIKDRYVLMVLNAVLDRRLYQELRGDRDLVYLAYASNFTGIDPGYFSIISATTPAKMKQVQQIILSEVDKVKANPVYDRELQKARNICLNGEILSKQTNADMGLQALLDELYGLGYRHGGLFKQILDGITADDLQKAAKAHFQHPLIVRIDGATEE